MKVSCVMSAVTLALASRRTVLARTCPLTVPEIRTVSATVEPSIFPCSPTVSKPDKITHQFHWFDGWMTVPAWKMIARLDTSAFFGTL